MSSYRNSKSLYSNVTFRLDQYQIYDVAISFDQKIEIILAIISQLNQKLSKMIYQHFSHLKINYIRNLINFIYFNILG